MSDARHTWQRPIVAFAGPNGMSRRDVMLVDPFDGGCFAAMLNATEQVFGSSEAAATRWCVKALECALNSDVLYPDHVDSLFSVLSQTLLIRQRYGSSELEPDPYNDYAPMITTLMLLYLERGRARLTWAGSEQAFWLRDGEVLAATTPHRFREHIRAEYGDDANAGAHGDIITHGIQGGVEQRYDCAEWEVERGDRVVMCSCFFDMWDVEAWRPLMAMERAQDAALSLIAEAQQRRERAWYGVMVWDIG